MGQAAKSVPPSYVVATKSGGSPNPDTVVPAANTAAVLTYAADTLGRRWTVGSIHYSYSAAPTGGRLTIQDGTGNVIFDRDIPATGPGDILFPFPRAGSVNTDLIITLAAGSGAVVGKLNATVWLDTA